MSAGPPASGTPPISAYQRALLDGLSAAELDVFDRVVERLYANAAKALTSAAP